MAESSHGNRTLQLRDACPVARDTTTRRRGTLLLLRLPKEVHLAGTEPVSRTVVLYPDHHDRTEHRDRDGNDVVLPERSRATLRVSAAGRRAEVDAPVHIGIEVHYFHHHVHNLCSGCVTCA